MTPAALTAALVAKAHALSFDKIAVAGAAPIERDRAALAAWLAADRHATMAWMARAPETRSSPGALLPGCRFVVALAMNYGPGPGTGTEIPAASDHARRARVARYAQSRDYHRVLGEKLKALASWLTESSGAASRAFVDTGPVLERAWAQASGLGWIGKNANLLTRDLGSWLLLGEVLTCAELVRSDGPHQDFCGTCTACLDACPTRAIVEPGVVDANLCISYWTIEHRGAVPEKHRAGNGDWIFGCDVCQEVCPWNLSHGRIPDGDPLARRDDLDGLDPIDILGLSEAEFRNRYSGTPLMRARWDGMRRNACIVLGNRRDQAALPALRRALDAADPMIREHASWAIGMIEGSSEGSSRRS